VTAHARFRIDMDCLPGGRWKATCWEWRDYYGNGTMAWRPAGQAWTDGGRLDATFEFTHRDPLKAYARAKAHIDSLRRLGENAELLTKITGGGFTEEIP
jgi:hypothetical protein